MNRLAYQILACLALPSILAAQVKLPAYEHRVLPNGVTLDLLAKKDVPMINVRVILKGGVESYPAVDAGLAAITAKMLERGTTTRSANQFADQLDFIGAQFNTYVDRQSTQISIEFLKKDTAKALELFTDALFHPSFTASEFSSLHSQAIDEARSSKDSLQQANANYFRAFFYGQSSPYGKPVQGDEISLARITREAVVKHHAAQYAGRNMIVIAVGDFDAGFGDTLAKSFGAIPAGSAHTWLKELPAASHPTARLLLIDKPDATQTYFTISQPGITRTHPDRIPLIIVNTLFGGRFTSMLNEELRTNTGLSYGASSRFDQDRLPGAFTISSYTRTDTTVKAIDLALDIVNRIRTQGINAAQLASAKAYMKGLFPTDKLETNDQLASVLGDIELHGLNKGEVDDYFSRIDAVNLEQANAAARKWINSANLQFCLLGNASAIKDQVKKYAAKMEIVPIGKAGYAVPAF